ncbi:MAG TPA: hypothetical protein VKT82_22270 [Ktedonobacterales bacterium]|nr:hypothetical protein [Ktedonobacterales bacterium]
MHSRQHISRLLLLLPFLAALLMSFPMLVSPGRASAADCPSSPSTQTGASAQIDHAPTLSLDTVTWALNQRGSPLSAADARFIVQASQQTSIDDAFALAVWAAESQDGREAVPGTHNIGNITAASGVAWADHIFAIYPTWRAGIAAWFQLIGQLYIRGGHAQNLLTFALFYVHGLTPAQASPQMQRVVESGYVHTLTSIIAELQQHEAALHPGQSVPGAGNETPPTAAPTTLFSLLPTGPLPPGWAGPGTWPAASAIRFSGCGTSSVPPLVLAAFQLGVYLRPNAAGLFDHWVLGAPEGVRSQGSITWDTDFLASVVEQTTGTTFPLYTTAASWWTGSLSQQLGWSRISAGSRQMPRAGDIAILSDGASGAVALIVGVQPPQAHQPGVVLVMQGHAPHVLERWALVSDGTVLPPWPFQTVTLGYLRPPAGTQ